jgi:hypothetical protein
VSHVESAGFDLVDIEENTEYEFTSERAANACQKYGVKGITLVASKR